MIKKTVATIGIFDGVHRGHQKILKKVVNLAKEQKRKSLVITFYPHPREILNSFSRVFFLTSLSHRIKLIKALGVDKVIVLKTTKKLLETPPYDFIKKILIEKYRISTLVVGKAFIFGYKKEGDFSLLKKAGKIYGFRIFGIAPLKMKGRFISSTRIRESVEKGDLLLASFMLARPVTVLGTVVKGRRTGRKLGFPTANIDPHHEAIPPSGVYSVCVKIDKRNCKAILNIGTRPTFFKLKYREPTIELHIINFNKNLYGRDLEIIFKKKIRNEKKFASPEELRKQIEKDVKKVRKF